MNISSTLYQNLAFHLDPLKPLRHWLDHLEIHDRHVAHCIAKMIPAQCPFERNITCFGRAIGHIPPLCKLNPIYDQLIGLRFRSLCYLVEKWDEDISLYC